MNNDTNTSKKPSKFFSRLGIAIMILIFIWVSSLMFGQNLLEVGTNAPPWSLELADGSGKMVNLQKMKGKVVVISFWSTTCPPCMKELANLNRLWPEFKEKGVAFVGIAAGGEDLKMVRSFNKKKKLRFPLTADDGNVAISYKVSSLPTLYVIDREGKVAFAHSGYMSKELLRREFNLALAR